MTADIEETISNLENFEEPSRQEICGLLATDREDLIFAAADRMRGRCVGNEVHLRGIIEFSNHCAKNCFYCGLRSDNAKLQRYRMAADEIVSNARTAKGLGLKTVILQSGEDPFYSAEALSDVIRRIKSESDVAVTVSVGDRPKKEYELFRKAGADRFLLKHETADPELFARLRPGTRLSERIERLRLLKELGFQVGAGNIVGLPGQTLESLAEDILLMKHLDVDMAGIGPFIPHPDTPLAESKPGSVDLVLRVLAVSRLVMPYCHLPATTALATLDPQGRERALACGANVIMPDITPLPYKKLYEIYPGKACVAEEAAECLPCMAGLIGRMGRTIAVDHGDSRVEKR
jgi:biotin synthase